MQTRLQIHEGSISGGLFRSPFRGRLEFAGALIWRVVKQQCVHQALNQGKPFGPQSLPLQLFIPAPELPHLPSTAIQKPSESSIKRLFIGNVQDLQLLSNSCVKQNVLKMLNRDAVAVFQQKKTSTQRSYRHWSGPILNHFITGIVLIESKTE